MQNLKREKKNAKEKDLTSLDVGEPIGTKT